MELINICESLKHDWTPERKWSAPSPHEHVTLEMHMKRSVPFPCGNKHTSQLPGNNHCWLFGHGCSLIVAWVSPLLLFICHQWLPGMSPCIQPDLHPPAITTAHCPTLHNLTQPAQSGQNNLTASLCVRLSSSDRALSGCTVQLGGHAPAGHTRQWPLRVVSGQCGHAGAVAHTSYITPWHIQSGNHLWNSYPL